MTVAGKVYSQDSILISEIIGRTYNNPLGQRAIQLIESALPSSKTPSLLLDIGCGRGAIASEIAQNYNANITAIDVSKEMLSRAQQKAHELGVSEKIHWIQGSFMDTFFEKKFDLVYSFDVFSYFPNKDALLRKIKSLLKLNSKIVFSDYFCDDLNNEFIKSVLSAWQLAPPGPYSEYLQILNNLNFKNIIQHNSTDIYYSHWLDIKNKLLANKKLILNTVCLESYQQYLRSVESIHNAVETKKFGHTVLCAQI